jgi:hypothetical protein
MEMHPGVWWAGSFDEKLFRLITTFAMIVPNQTRAQGSLVRSAFFDRHTVETLCNALTTAEDCVTSVDANGFESYHPTSSLTEAEKERMFATAHSPYYGPLVGLANILRDSLANPTRFNSNAHIYQPLKKHWSQIIQHLWDNPARCLESHDKFREERFLVSYIFCRIVEVEPSFGSVINDESDLTLSLLARYWAHETGETEIGQLFIFFLMLFPRRAIPGGPRSGMVPLLVVAAGERDNTLPFLQRILQNNEFIAEFIQGTASHLRRFRDFEATGVATIIEKLWNWARAFEKDPLCSEFLRVIRTSATLWSGFFEASSRSTDKHITASFENTPHYYMSSLASHLVHCRASSDEAKALCALWVSTGVFDALEVTVWEALRHGTEDEQVELSKYVSDIFQAISYGPERDFSFMSSLRQQLPRPRTIRRLWDLSLKLSSCGIQKVAPSHAARMTLFAMQQLYFLPAECTRRSCEKKSTARCPHCRLGYCSRDCQVRDWRDHKMVCNVQMDMDPAVRDETFKLVAGPAELAKVQARVQAK